MKQQQHIAFKIAAIVLLLAVMLPSAVKFTHVFENHKHEVCTDYSTNHMHQIDLECEFFKFKLNTQYYPTFEVSLINSTHNFSEINTTLYNFNYNHQQLSYSLRGPPFLV
ncbi:hypothetical protein [Olleya sp. Bg11-27]|uniref:hypothetical protein n=1 Tax=Olleya sp. Bg11-27 TaxID=2058135 RepID=UPI000C31477D|nr:hypothetical protein [Olleya sp. Bg11-27]AUC76658.1 hypothetical protein CW732_13650 [Olleya sp. Bg11-27]